MSTPIAGEFNTAPATVGSGQKVNVQTDAQGRLLTGGPGPTPPTPPSTSPYTQAAISTASSGDNTLVSGTAQQTIRVFKIVWTLAAGTITLKDGAGTSLTGAMAATVGVLESTDQNPIFVTSAGNAFIANLSGANQLSGAIWYVKS